MPPAGPWCSFWPPLLPCGPALAVVACFDLGFAFGIWVQGFGALTRTGLGFRVKRASVYGFRVLGVRVSVHGFSRLGGFGLSQLGQRVEGLFLLRFLMLYGYRILGRGREWIGSASVNGSGFNVFCKTGSKRPL